ncbi:hypothetical protein RJ640_018348 [Escallonia rubra]|uniref:Uncharacterized protein n=1 Tax=Escallonia rubra TaxID=112253 RepID=A0AA88R4J7_9ASTE|nr:hypothetical protein RJ640_018348 [Escallonia rubra]
MAKGMLPITWFLSKESSCRLMRFSIPAGILPKILLLPSNNLCNPVEKLVTASGNTPPNWLPAIPTVLKLLELDKPVRKLKSSASRLPRLLEHMITRKRLGKRPKSRETFPPKELDDISSTESQEAFDNDIGTRPVNIFPPTSNALIVGNLRPRSEPKPPEPIKLSEEKPPVAMERLSYETFKNKSNVGEDSGKGSLLVFLSRLIIRRDMIKTSTRSPESSGIISLRPRDFSLFFNSFFGHPANCNSGIPPQSLAFPATEIVVAFAKTPSVGSSPSKWLKDKFKFSNKNR